MPDFDNYEHGTEGLARLRNGFEHMICSIRLHPNVRGLRVAAEAMHTKNLRIVDPKQPGTPTLAPCCSCSAPNHGRDQQLCHNLLLRLDEVEGGGVVGRGGVEEGGEGVEEGGGWGGRGGWRCRVDARGRNVSANSVALLITNIATIFPRRVLSGV